MTSSVERVKAIFIAALERPTIEERRAYLMDVCGDDLDLRQNVDELLNVHDAVRASEHSESASGGGIEAESLLGTSSGAQRPVLGRTHRDESRDVLPTGEINGRYRIIEVLGEGGMGIVCLAQQLEPVRRLVALKVIKLGMDSRRVLSRFEAERQALALLEHPNIAKVYDGGMTSDGRPYFVMEYVKGVALTDYCDSNRLTIRERLALFLQVCKAVQHAHQKGIIHRDLKPSNILVALYDDKAVVKVIDFGLAKAIHQPLSDFSQFTPHGTAVGTAMYMSPEQAIFNNLDIDTRTDIYSLGVILYELLTGTTPLERQRYKQAAWDEVLRIIREEEPMRPSTKLSSTGELPSIAAQRRTEPIKLNRMLRGDLDWIVMKSLEKERNRRYDTASSLALDIQHYLNEEPVNASPPSTWYRFRKFARRNQGTVAMVAILVASLATGIVGTTWGMLKAKRAQIRAMQSAAVSQAVEQLLLDDIIAQGDPQHRAAQMPGFEFNDVTLRKVLERAGGVVRDRFGHSPHQEAAIQMTLGKAFRGLGDYSRAERHLTRAFELFKSTQFRDQPELRRDAELELARLWTLADPPQAIPVCRRIVADLTAAYGASDSRVLLAQTQLAGALQANGQVKEAMEQLRPVFDEQQRTLGPHHPDTLRTRELKAMLDGTLGNRSVAIEEVQTLLEEQRAILPQNDPALAIMLNNLGWLYQMEMRSNRSDIPKAKALSEKALQCYTEALQIMDQAHGREHPAYVTTQISLALLQANRGNLAEAIRIHNEIEAKIGGLVTSHSEGYLAFRNNQAAILEAQGEIERARDILQANFDSATAAYEPGHALIQATESSLQKFLNNHPVPLDKARPQSDVPSAEKNDRNES